MAETDNAALEEKSQLVIRMQLLASILISGLFLIQGIPESLSALYGGFVSVVIAWFLGRGINRASRVAAEDPKKSMVILYVGAVQRFLLVVVLLATGLALLKLEPIALCVGFAIVRISHFVNPRCRI
jgi:ATP synthase protein I